MTNIFRTLDQVISMASSEHERKLIEKYFVNLFGELGADPQLAKGMFQAFPIDEIQFCDFCDITLTREEVV